MRQLLVSRRSFALVTCLSALLLLTIKSSAQSAEDTATWLQTRLQALSSGAPIHVRVTADTLEWTDYKHFKIQFKDLTSVHFKPRPAGQGPDCSKGCSVATVFLVSKGDKESTAGLPLSEATESDGTRVVKAIEHLARENGAKIVDDNLF